MQSTQSPRWSYFLTGATEAAIEEAKRTKTRPDATERWISALQDARKRAIERMQACYRMGCIERRVMEPGEGELTPSEQQEQQYMRGIRMLEATIAIAYLPHLREAIKREYAEE